MTAAQPHPALSTLTAHIKALQKARTSGDPRFEPHHLEAARLEAVDTVHQKTSATLDKLTESIPARRAQLDQRAAELDSKATAADLVRRGQAWDRVRQLLDAGVNLSQLVKRPAEYLPGDDPVTVLAALRENGPVYAQVNADGNRALPSAAELVQMVDGAMVEQPGPVGDLARERVELDQAERLTGAARGIADALTSRHMPNERDLSVLYLADQATYNAVREAWRTEGVTPSDRATIGAQEGGTGA